MAMFSSMGKQDGRAECCTMWMISDKSNKKRKITILPVRIQGWKEALNRFALLSLQLLGSREPQGLKPRPSILGG
jgi:hypothetical protein